MMGTVIRFEAACAWALDDVRWYLDNYGTPKGLGAFSEMMTSVGLALKDPDRAETPMVLARVAWQAVVEGARTLEDGADSPSEEALAKVLEMVESRSADSARGHRGIVLRCMAMVMLYCVLDEDAGVQVALDDAVDLAGACCSLSARIRQGRYSRVEPEGEED